jgi:hypothetical protein
MCRHFFESTRLEFRPRQSPNLNYTSWYVCTISQQMHYSDSLLITSYSSYMFRRTYVIIREPSFECRAELH